MHEKQILTRWYAAFVLLLATGASVDGARAADTAKLSGVVFTLGADGMQVAWPNARITLTNLATRAAVSTVSGDTGEFLFADVPAGEYELTVALEGFEMETQKVMLPPKGDVHAEIMLRPRGVRERVTVGEQVQPEPAATQATSPTRLDLALKSAPLLNDQFQDVLPLLPGVVRGPDGLINIKGARVTQTGTLVNSTSVVDPATGDSAISLPIEAVNSVRVVANPFSAEYGRFTGGVVEVETRSGTDKWKFGVQNFLPRFRIRDGGINGIRAVTPRLSFSGPLAPGKAYIFQSLDYRFVRTRVPSLPAPVDETMLEAFDSYTQLDWNLNATNRLTMSLVIYPQNLGYVSLNTFNPQPVTPNLRQRGFFAAISERAIFGAGGFLDSSFSSKRFDAHTFAARFDPTGLTFFPDQNFGGWYNRQDRESWLHQASQTYNFPQWQAAGTHYFQVGYQFGHSSYDGTVENLPVTLLRTDGTLAEQITYGPGAPVEAKKNDFAVFVQDRWQIRPRFSLDWGLRLDREDLSGDVVNVAPRLAVVVAATSDNKTIVRAGGGVFYDKVPLNIKTFQAYPAQTATRFAADGMTVVSGPTPFTHRITTSDGKIRAPYSIAWNLQLDRELTRGLLMRLSYEQREVRRDFFTEPLEVPLAGIAEWQLRNDGQQRYHEYMWMLRWVANERSTLFLSYVRSRTTGELNDFEHFFSNFPDPIVRANQRGRMAHDAPNRVLFWGAVGLPWKLEFLPVLDIHDGFPFSALDNEWNYVGRRNEAGRFPWFFTLDFQLVRPIAIPFRGRKWNTKIGVKLFNVTNHFNPRDVQRNIFSPDFGTFYNSIERKVRFKFEVEY